MSELLILNHDQIEKKVERLAYEIIEKNHDAKKIYLAGINNNGLAFATLIHTYLKKISDLDFELVNIRMNPAKPSEDIEINTDGFRKKVVIVVDDVANTGRSIFYACQPLLKEVPKSIQVAVLVDRKHKMFPIQVDFVGLSLATTFKENIKVVLGKENNVYLG